ncbi:copper chaperone PCu(A)C [[Pseudomonas] carboxydohydrogena]|uniref:Copper chaperone PCu(A)C n=1 Tax=Afipia carboxydohydrogena TaxID=290 RepID=A0ABY8BJR1_AFICR|nr:copper chaperone PCu(A)C [[Pseudomonas] carboxydohydrogena]
MALRFSLLRTSFVGAAVFGMLATSSAIWAQDHSSHPAMTMSPSMTMKPAMAMQPAAAASGAQFKAGDLVVTSPWSRATPKGAKIGAGYLTVRNNGATADRLLSVEADIAGKADIHEMSMKDGVMHMRPLGGRHHDRARQKPRSQPVRLSPDADGPEEAARTGSVVRRHAALREGGTVESHIPDRGNWRSECAEKLIRFRGPACRGHTVAWGHPLLAAAPSTYGAMQHSVFPGLNRYRSQEMRLTGKSAA